MESTRRLVKSKSNRMIDGVCAGMADFFGIDVTLVRIAFVVFAFAGGLTVVAYITGMIVMPSAPEGEEKDEQLKADRHHVQTGLFWGIVLILAGIIFLLEGFHIFDFHWLGRMFTWKWILPVTLIAVGLMLILRRDRAVRMSDTPDTPAGGKFRRKSAGKKIWGVCGGIAEHLQWDVSIVRIGFVLLTLLTFPLGIVAYVLVALLTPDESDQGVFSSKSANS